MFFDADQEGQTGNAQLVEIYDATGTTVKGSFSLASPITFTAADLALEPGNGEGGFFFALTDPEKAEFATLLAVPGSGNFIDSASAS